MKKIMLLSFAIMLSICAFAQNNDQQSAPPVVKKTVRVVGHGPAIATDQHCSKGFYYGIPALTDTQKATIDKLRSTLTKDMRKVQNQVKEKKARLNSLQDEEKPDQKAIYKTIDEIAGLQGQMMKLRADFRIKVDEQLNEDQKEAFRQNGDKVQHMVHNRSIRVIKNNNDVVVHTEEE